MGLKSFLKKYSDFNQYYRDIWVSQRAKEIRNGAMVLDAGAGFGRYRELFTHCKYKSQDFCQYNGPEWHYEKVDYVCDIVNIPVKNETFDVILCTEVLEHVPEPIKVIEEFSRILRKGGELLLTAPLGCGLHQEPHIYYGGFTPYWYKRFLEKHGFEVAVIVPNGGFFKHYGQESVRIISYFIKEGGMIKKFIFMPVMFLMKMFFAFLIPFLCSFLEKAFFDDKFTVGYFVKATKK